MLNVSPDTVPLTLIYAAVGLYDTHSLKAFSPKVPMCKNSETVCIHSPTYCLYTVHIFLNL